MVVGVTVPSRVCCVQSSTYYACCLYCDQALLCIAGVCWLQARAAEEARRKAEEEEIARLEEEERRKAEEKERKKAAAKAKKEELKRQGKLLTGAWTSGVCWDCTGRA